MKTLNIKFRHNRKVAGEQALTFNEFIELTSATKAQMKDLEEGYKVQGSINFQGKRFTYVATKHW